MSPILDRAIVRHEAKIEIVDLRAALGLPADARITFRDDAMFVAWESTGIESPAEPPKPAPRKKSAAIADPPTPQPAPTAVDDTP